MRAPKKVAIHTASGYPLTPKEDKFISVYVETGNATQAVEEAGYKVKAKRQLGNKMLSKDYIAEEIRYRMDNIRKDTIASAEEIMQYFTDVMRGNIKDQFDMEASLSERTKAAQELAKRQIDIPNKLAGNEVPEVKITLNWEGMKDE